jgi:phage-related protein
MISDHARAASTDGLESAPTGPRATVCGLKVAWGLALDREPGVLSLSLVHPRAGAGEGYTDPAATPLKGFAGRSVTKIVMPFGGNPWRAVYTVRFRGVVYVLHAFQKKSKSGIATPKSEMDLIRRRLAVAERHYREGADRT